MSFILNALRKSELERQSGQSEFLEHKIQQRPVEIQKKSSQWIIVLVIINVLFLGYFIGTSTKVLDKEEVSPEEEMTTNQEYSTDSALNRPEYGEKQLSIAEQLNRKKNQRQQVIKHQPVKQIVAAKAVKLVKKKPLLKRPEKVKKNKAETDSKKAKIKAIAAIKPIVKIKPVAVVENKPPFLSELDYEFRRKTPSIDINVFVYSEQKENRFIMLNMKKFIAEQDIIPGMKLKEIRVNSIVVKYKGKMFQIKR